MLKTKAVFVGVALCLTSCAGINQSYSKLKIQRCIDLDSSTEEALSYDVFAKGGWPKKEWWEEFDDPQLNEFIEIGLKSSPTLSSAQALIAQANQEAFVVRSKLFPTINGLFNMVWSQFSKEGIQYHVPTLKNDFHLYTLALSFDYEFDFWNKNRYAFEAALGMARVQEAMYEQSRLVVSTAIATQYFQLMANMLKMEILQEVLLAKTKNLELVNLRKLNRIDNLLNLNSMREEVVTLQESLAALKEELELERSMLFTLMGKNPDEKIPIRLHWGNEAKPLKIPENIGSHLLARRPDLIAQVWRVTSAAKQIGVAFAEFFPSVNLSMYGGLESLKINDLLTGNAWSPHVLPRVSLPIFTGGKLRGNFKAKVAAYESAVYSYNNQLLEAANEVVSSITKLTSLDERLKYQDLDVEYAKQNYNLTYERYKHGIDSMISVLHMDETYLWAKYSQVDLQRLQKEAAVSLVRSLGGGYVEQGAVEVLDKTIPDRAAVRKPPIEE